MKPKYLFGILIILVVILAVLLILFIRQNSINNSAEQLSSEKQAEYIVEEIVEPDDIAVDESAVSSPIEQSGKKVEVLNNVGVVINHFQFYPKGIVIAPGTSVTWLNNDTVPHKVVAYDRLFYGPKLMPGERYTFTFTQEGSHSYFDAVFPKTGKGKIIVQEEPLPITGGVIGIALNDKERDGKFALVTVLFAVMIFGISHAVYAHRRF